MEKKKNILIIGTGAAAQALAKKLNKNDQVGRIYATLANDSDFYTKIDIREYDHTELLKFALENDIYLTIPTSYTALNSDIVSFFNANGQNIFGPTKQACSIALSKAAGKKFLYKIHAQTSKFAVFDKLSAAQEYITTANYPITIKCTKNSGLIGGRLTAPTISYANDYLNDIFNKDESEVLIEEFTYGHNFTLYFITDGYSAIPITSVCNYKFTKAGQEGILTNGTGCYAPDFKVTETILSRVQNIVANTLKTLAQKSTPYIGILGIECIITGEDKFYVSEFKQFFQDHDASAVFNLVEDDLIKIFISCINGSFSDEYESIKTNDYSSVSAVISAEYENEQIKGLDLIEDINDVDFINTKITESNTYYAQKDTPFTITRTASTLARAKKYLCEDLSCIHFRGMKYRKDICLENNFGQII